MLQKILLKNRITVETLSKNTNLSIEELNETNDNGELLHLDKITRYFEHRELSKKYLRYVLLFGILLGVVLFVVFTPRYMGEKAITVFDFNFWDCGSYSSFEYFFVKNGTWFLFVVGLLATLIYFIVKLVLENKKYKESIE